MRFVVNKYLWLAIEPKETHWRWVQASWRPPKGEQEYSHSLAVFPLHGHFDCLFSRIIHRQVSRGWGDLRSPHPLLAFNSYHRQTVKKNWIYQNQSWKICLVSHGISQVVNPMYSFSSLALSTLIPQHYCKLNLLNLKSATEPFNVLIYITKKSDPKAALFAKTHLNVT